MRIAVSVDMEGASQLRSVREIWGCLPEYWQTGKPRLEADVAAACEGLLAAGASEILVLDNHGGNTVNVSQEVLPDGARLETWRDFDLHEHQVDATFQVGYHPRGGVDGFLSHTMMPGLRLRANGELISESHCRAWASGVPLLGITGNDLHRETLGSLEGTPFLVTQISAGRAAMTPVWDNPADGYAAIRQFAERCLADAGSAPPVTPPSDFLFETSMPNGADAVDELCAAGWTRIGEVEFQAELATWAETRELIAAAMNAGIAPYLPYWIGGFASAEDAAAADRDKVEVIRMIFDAWADEAQPQWYTAPTDPLPPGIEEQLRLVRP